MRCWNYRGGREGVGRETEKGGPSCTLLHGCPRRVRGAGVRPCPSARQPVREARVRQWCGSGGRTTWCRRPRCDTVAPVLVALPIRRECRPWPQQQPPCSSVPMLVGVRVRRQRSAGDGRSNARPTGVEKHQGCDSRCADDRVHGKATPVRQRHTGRCCTEHDHDASEARPSF